MGKPDRIEFTCPTPGCGARVRAPVERAGRGAVCPKCEVKVRVPAPAPPPEPEVFEAEVAEPLPLPPPRPPAAPARSAWEPVPEELEDAADETDRAGPVAAEASPLLPGCLAGLGLPAGFVAFLLFLWGLYLLETWLGRMFWTGWPDWVVGWLLILPGLIVFTAAGAVAGFFAGRRLRQYFAIELEPGERCLWRRRPIPLTGAGAVLGGPLALILMAGLADMSGADLFLRFTEIKVATRIVIYLGLLSLLPGLAVVLANLLTLLVVTDRRVVLKRRSGTLVLHLADVRAVTLDPARDEDRWNGMLYDSRTTITFEARDGGGPDVAVRGLLMPVGFHRELRKLVRRSRPGG